MAEHNQHPAGFLALPAELRCRIYEYALGNVTAKPLLVERHPKDQWLLRKHVPVTCPSILLLRKQIHTECQEILGKLRTDTTSPSASFADCIPTLRALAVLLFHTLLSRWILADASRLNEPQYHALMPVGGVVQ